MTQVTLNKDRLDDLYRTIQNLMDDAQGNLDNAFSHETYGDTDYNAKAVQFGMATAYGRALTEVGRFIDGLE